MSPTTVFVVGASRGIGYAIVSRFASLPHFEIIAAVKDAAEMPALPQTHETSTVRFIPCDMTDEASVEAAAQEIPTLDILIANAAIGDDDKILKMTMDRFREFFEVNVVGTHRIVTSFLPALRKGKQKKIMVVSSASGSMAIQINVPIGFSGPYAVSKAACNMLAIQYHNELNNDEKAGFIVVPVHPGWVNTPMGNIVGKPSMQPEESANGIVDLALRLKPEDSAKFFQWDGQIVPW